MKKDTEVALLKDIETRDKLEALFTQPGWKVIEKFFNDKYNQAINRLKTAKDVTRDQALIAVLDSLMEELGVTVMRGNQAKIVLQQYKEREINEYV